MNGAAMAHEWRGNGAAPPVWTGVQAWRTNGATRNTTIRQNPANSLKSLLRQFTFLNGARNDLYPCNINDLWVRHSIRLPIVKTANWRSVDRGAPLTRLGGGINVAPFPVVADRKFDIGAQLAHPTPRPVPHPRAISVARVPDAHDGMQPALPATHPHRQPALHCHASSVAPPPRRNRDDRPTPAGTSRSFGGRRGVRGGSCSDLRPKPAHPVTRLIAHVDSNHAPGLVLYDTSVGINAAMLLCPAPTLPDRRKLCPRGPTAHRIDGGRIGASAAVWMVGHRSALPKAAKRQYASFRLGTGILPGEIRLTERIGYCLIVIIDLSHQLARRGPKIGLDALIGHIAGGVVAVSAAPAIAAVDQDAVIADRQILDAAVVAGGALDVARDALGDVDHLWPLNHAVTRAEAQQAGVFAVIIGKLDFLHPMESCAGHFWHRVAHLPRFGRCLGFADDFAPQVEHRYLGHLWSPPLNPEARAGWDAPSDVRNMRNTLAAVNNYFPHNAELLHPRAGVLGVG